MTNDPRTQANATQMRFNGDVKAVRADNNLTPQGKKNKIAALTVTRDKKLSDIRAQAEAGRKQRLGELTNRLFRVSKENQAEFFAYATAAESYKDDGALARAMNMAERHGNTLLLQALAESAYDRGYPHLTETYFETVGLSETYREFASLNGSDTSYIDRMNDDAVLRGSRPDELVGASTQDIKQAAAQSEADDAAGAA